MKIYCVGGAVRDKLLGHEVAERDWVVTGATPEDMEAQGFFRVGRDFPVYIHPRTGEEYALARTESKAGRGHHGFTLYFSPDTTLEEDLKRRDLTINAMAEDDTGRIHDPYGGLDDLKAGILRHVSEAFVEDPLRVLRVARFGARFYSSGFRIASETMALMRRICAGNELNTLPVERISRELLRAMKTASPGHFFVTLRQCGALEVLFPEFDNLGLTAEADDGQYETGNSALRILAETAKLTPVVDIRLAALFYGVSEQHRQRYSERIDALEQLSQRLKFSTRLNKLNMLSLNYARQCLDSRQLSASQQFDLFVELDILRRPEHLQQLLVICQGAAAARGDSAEQQQTLVSQLKAAAMAYSDVRVDSPDFAGLKGEQLGRAIRKKRLQQLQALLSSS